MKSAATDTWRQVFALSIFGAFVLKSLPTSGATRPHQDSNLRPRWHHATDGMNRCLHLAKPTASRLQQTKIIAVWAEMNRVLMNSGARYHLEWGSLLGWYRECSFIPSDHDLDITIWASDWTPELREELKAAVKRAWCPAVEESHRVLKHPKYPHLVTPVQTILMCVGKPYIDPPGGMKMDFIDIVYMHRPVERDYIEKKWPVFGNSSMLSEADLIKAVQAEPLSKASDRTWWVSNNDVAEHWTYAPYTLAPARVFGELSYVPANTASHLKSVYGEWARPNRYATNSKQDHPNTVIGKPKIEGNEFWEEWWEVDADGEPARRVKVTMVPAGPLEALGKVVPADPLEEALGTVVPVDASEELW